MKIYVVICNISALVYKLVVQICILHGLYMDFHMYLKFELLELCLNSYSLKI
jgi:hypothetical protein